MSEADASDADDGEYEGGRPVGLYLLVGVVVVLVAVSGMFATGFIPPIAKIGTHHTTSTNSTRASVQFITVTSTEPGGTITQTVKGINTTSTSTTTSTTTVAGANTTTTQTSTTTVTSVTLSTTTTATTVLVPTTTTSTLTTTTTTTVAPTAPLTINVTMDPPANPSALYAGEHFTVSVAVHNMLPSTSLTLNAYQVSSQNTPQVLSFYPQVPESLTPVVGDSSYTIAGNVSQTAPVGDYQMVVEVDASSPGVTVNSVSQQYLIHLSEPLSFTGYKVINATSNFSGTCTPGTVAYSGNTNWYWQCAITAAPNATGSIAFNVTNSANVPICISTAIQSSTLTGFVNMNPYPFCPKGVPGVYVPANVTNWTFTYVVVSGFSAGSQTAFFLFQRTAVS